MADERLTIEVDGKTLSANSGQMLIEVTDAHDIYIPRFCYHDKLSVAANCRMCLVEVEKAPKALPACATPVMDGMKVKTRSTVAVEAQKSVMEFLLINHPLDCPICDQGGECELQDLAMGYGRDVSRYREKKRVVKDKNIGPLIQTDLTRCIHCTRCVRFGEEISGIRELGATGRGENMQIGTYIEKSVVSEMSGNIIDLCPVGALTSKPFRYSARAWELVQKDAIAPHDSVGSNIHIHVKGDRVKRVVPANNESINEVWLSDRDRFSYEAVDSETRLQTPMIKDGNEWKAVAWEIALDTVRQKLQSIIDDHGVDQLGALASPSSTVEELYLLQKLMGGLGSNNIDTRLRQIDFSDQDTAPLFPWLGMRISALESIDAALLIGSHVRTQQPIINHRLRKAVLNGAKIMVVNPVDYDFNYPITGKFVVSPDTMADELAGILKALSEISGLDDRLTRQLARVSVDETHRNTAEILLSGNNSIIVLGCIATSHPQFSLLRTLAGEIAKASGAAPAYLSDGANSAGAWLVGALPHRRAGGVQRPTVGKNCRDMLQSQLKAYLLLGVEPELDCWDSRAASDAMSNADFVLSLTSFTSKAIEDYADVMLPVSVFTETSGTYINNEGTGQSFTGVVPPLGESRPPWKVLRVLGNYFELDGFDFQSSTDVYDEALQQIGELEKNNTDHWQPLQFIASPSDGLQRISETPANRIDPVCRRATALQQTLDSVDGAIHINSSLAEKNNLNHDDRVDVEQDDRVVNVKVCVDDRVPDECVLVQSSQPELVQLGAAFGSIRIKAN